MVNAQAIALAGSSTTVPLLAGDEDTALPSPGPFPASEVTFPLPVSTKQGGHHSLVPVALTRFPLPFPLAFSPLTAGFAWLMLLLLLLSRTAGGMS